MAGFRVTLQLGNDFSAKSLLYSRCFPSKVVAICRKNVQIYPVFHIQNARCFATTQRYLNDQISQEKGIQTDDKLVPSQSNQNLVDQAPNLYRERFIPLTRRTTVAHLIKDEQKLTVAEKKEFEKFALSLDAVVSSRYAATLEELKQLFDPISPDKDTIAVRQYTREDRLDNEFWLLQRLSQVMEKANFYELTEQEVNAKLKEKESVDGVKVSINAENYDIIKFWVLGKQRVEVNRSILESIRKLFVPTTLNQTPTTYRRVVAAVRMKQDDKLTLKAFKDIPTDELEKLLPMGTITIGRFDRRMMIASLALTSAGVFAKLLTYLAKLQVNWPLGFAALCSVFGVKGFWMYKSRQNKYLSNLNSTLYYKNIANNRGLITLVVDRAQDESFKEALLTYTFIHALNRASPGEFQTLDKPSGEVSIVALEDAVEQWIYEHTGTSVEFDSAESISILEKVGILSRHSRGLSETLTVLPLEPAHRLLPQTPLSILTRVNESDVTEGYDKSRYDDTKPTKRKSYGGMFSKLFKR